MSSDPRDDLGEYTTENFQVLRDCEHIRKRPAMYLEDRGEFGLFHHALSVIQFCLDHADLPQELEATLLPDDGMRINCRRLAFPEGELEALATRPAGRLRDDRPRLAFSLSGLGLSVGNALSSSFVIDSHHAGSHWRQAFAQGCLKGPLERVGPSADTAVTLTFYPDPDIFERTAIPRERLANQFRELAALLPGSRFTLSGPGEERQEFHSPAGLVDLLAWHARELTPVCAPIGETVVTEEGRASVAFAWYEEAPETIYGYCNAARVPRGNTCGGCATP